MPTILSGTRVCITFPPPHGELPQRPPICWDMRAHGPDLSASAEQLDRDSQLADVSILFSMYELANQLSDHELRSVVLSSVTSGIVFAGKLPHGVELQLNKEVNRDAK
jgi:hypothetical protein